ncbi:protein takeout [Aethina tumida]|uniref:protein takeout n=1 Tax=Aethina tumida TaxID=116153 RepID=UPI00096B0B20|nr:protein takeout [Aethina tumida]
MGIHKLLLITLVCVFLNLVEAKPKLPTFMKVCHRSDPNLKDCIKQSVEQLRPLLAKGIPEFDIPSCEPLWIPEVSIDQGTGSVALQSNYKDIKVYGPSKFVIKFVKIDVDKNKMKIKIWLPRLEINSNYTMEGRILMMPIQGTGTTTGNYTDIDATVLMQGERVKKGEETYFNIKDFTVDFNIGKAEIQLNNLFNGDQELGEAMNLFLNDNWNHVANEIKPVLEDTIATLFKKFANKIFHKYPLDQLLPE